jgi:exonuclease V gamma subunit
LVSCAQGEIETARLIGRGDKKPVHVKQWRSVPRDRACAILADLTSIYLNGQQQPLPFMPITSEAYFAKHGGQEGLEKAAGEFDPDGNGEAAREPHAARAFSGLLPPFDPEFDAGRKQLEQTEFHRLALAVFDPMDEWQEEA